VKSSSPKPERSLKSDPEALLSEELKYLPLSMHLEQQVRQLRSLEKAMYRAGKSPELGRRHLDNNISPDANEQAFKAEQHNKYLAPIKVHFALPAGELCYLNATARWQHIFDIKVSPDQLPDPALPSKHLSVRRRGEIPDHPAPHNEIALVSGHFYLTNRRVIMISEGKQQLSINLRSAFKRTIYRNAIEIHHMDNRFGRAYCDSFFLPEGDIQLADSLFQCFG